MTWSWAGEDKGLQGGGYLIGRRTGGQEEGDASVPTPHRPHPASTPPPAPTGMKALPRRSHSGRPLRSPYISRYLRTAQGNAPEGVHYAIVGAFEVIVEAGIFYC